MKNPQKINVLQLIKEQKEKQERQNRAQLCMLGYCKTEEKR